MSSRGRVWPSFMNDMKAPTCFYTENQLCGEATTPRTALLACHSPPVQSLVGAWGEWAGAKQVVSTRQVTCSDRRLLSRRGKRKSSFRHFNIVFVLCFKTSSPSPTRDGRAESGHARSTRCRESAEDLPLDLYTNLTYLGAGEAAADLC